MTETYPLRAIGEAEFPAFYGTAAEAFNDAWPAEPQIRNELRTFEFDRSLAAFDGPAIVGTAAALTVRLTVPGAAATAAGVSFVSVRPSHRRRGVLSAMMRRQLADIRERGETIAALWSSEAGIYGRYGYGPATAHTTFTIRRGEGTLARPEGTPTRPEGTPTRPQAAPARAAAAQSAPQPRLRIAEPQQARAELAKVYDGLLPGRPGMLARDDRWWDTRLFDPDYRRSGGTPLRCVIAGDDTGPRGYALYSARPGWADNGIPEGTLVVRELMAADPAACASLWADLLTRDLVSEVSAPGRPADDPLPHLLADPRRARAQVSDGLWVRLIDVPRALAQRRYACPVDTVIEVTDEIFGQNSGRWRLRAAGPADPEYVSCEPATAPADLALPVRVLGAAYLGGTRLGALAAAGLVAEPRPGALAALSAAMSWDPAPWCPSIF